MAPSVSAAMGALVTASVAVIAAMVAAIATLAAELEAGLSSTRTPGWSVLGQDSRPCSAPGRSASSATSRTVMPPPSLPRTDAGTPALRALGNRLVGILARLPRTPHQLRRNHRVGDIALPRRGRGVSGLARLRDASSEPAREGYTCATCGRHIITAIEGLFSNPNVGSPTRFCDASCRQAAYRRRRADVAENAPRQLTGWRAR